MTAVSLSAHSRANSTVCPCANANVGTARDATRASVGRTWRSRIFGQAKVLTIIDLSPASISIAGGYKVVDGGDDVENKPSACHDHEPFRIVRRRGCMRALTQGSIRPTSAWPDFALIRFPEFTAVLVRLHDRLSPPRLTGAFFSQRQRIGRGLHEHLQDWRDA